MAADIREDNQPYDEINIVPMLDLAYVLLVMFIILTTAAVQGIRVDLPQTQAAANLAKPQTRAITVTREGNVFLDAFPVDMEQLEIHLARHRAANPGMAVVLRGDGEAPYEKIMQALEICKRLDIVEIGLVSKRVQ